MSVVWVYARSRWRTNWRSGVALALIAGLCGGAVLALVAGGRRSESAYPRFVRRYRGADAEIFFEGPPSASRAYLGRAASLPGVIAHGLFTGYTESQGTTAIAPVDPGAEHTVNVPKILSGRLPAPRAALEVAVNFTFAGAHHLRVGDPLTLDFTGDAAKPGVPAPTLHVTTRVVGITATALQFPPIVLGEGDEILLSPAFVPRFQSRLGVAGVALAVRLRGGDAAVDAYQSALAKQFPNEPVLAQTAGPQTAEIRQSIHPEAVGLWMLAGCLGVVSALVLFQLSARQTFLEGDHYAVLADTGATRAQIMAIDLLRNVAIAAVAAVLAVGTAIAISPLFPLGTARTAEPHPGLSLDAFVLGAGGVGMLVLVIALGIRPAWSAARRAARRDSPAEALGRRGGRSWARPEGLWLGPVAAIGASYALRTGRGRAAVPVRAASAATVIAVTGLIAAVTFGASLDHVLATPRLYGWNWDAQVFDLGSAGTANLAGDLRDDSWISDAVLVDNGVPLSINGAAVDGVGLHSLKGVVDPVLRAGRAPAGPSQITLGSNTMRHLGVRVGDQVRVRITAISNGPTRTLRVVGSVIVPALSQAGHLGDGAMLSASAFASLVPKTARDVPGPGAVFVRFAPGAMTASHLATLRGQIGPEYVVLRPQPPTDVLNFGRVQNLPLALGLLLALLAIATLATTIVSSGRRRRAELATLKTIGYVPRQIRGVVACQATTMAVIGCIVGVPLGIAVGRLLWTLVADQFGTIAVTVLPWFLIAGVAGSVVVVANLIALLPGELAARARPAPALRAM